MKGSTMNFLKKHCHLFITTVAVSLAVFSCSDNSAPVSVSDSSENLIATIDLEQDGIIKFTEPEAGELVVDLTLRSMDLTPNGDADSPLDLYKYYSGKEAPEALKAAYSRALASRSKDESADDDDADIQEGTATPLAKSAMSAGDFQDNYCASGWDFQYCWLSRTNTSYVQRKCWYIRTTVNPYQGNVMQKLRYKKLGSWHTYVDKSVTQGQVSWIYHYGSTRYRRVEVYEASGDAYHHSIYGLD